MGKMSSLVKREVIKISLVTAPKEYIEFYNDLLFGEVKEIEAFKNQKDTDDIDLGVKMIILLAKNWSLTDDDGKVLPINIENLEKLPNKDLVHVGQEVAKIITGKSDKKKDITK